MVANSLISKNKKSQMTFYIILGIIIVIIVGAYFALKSASPFGDGSERQKQVEGQMDVSAMLDFGQKCLETVAEEGVIANAMQAGFYNLPDTYLDTDYGHVPYYYYNGINMLPQRETLEMELGEYIDSNLHLCIRKFRSFRDMGYEIDAGKATTTVKIFDDTVQVDTEYPVIVSKDGMQSSINSFNAVLEIPYGRAYDVASLITNDVIQDPYFIHHSSNYEHMLMSGLQIDSISYGKSVMYIVRDDNQNYINSMKLVYLFVTKPSDENSKPQIILDEDSYELNVGEEFVLYVNADDVEEDLIEFSDDTDLFDIGKYSGRIKFTPTVDDVGSYFVKITADDGKDTDEIELSFRVK